MEGCQHNTMDVEYYGPNPQMQFLYLGAIKALKAMAEATGDNETARTCGGLYANGSAWTEKNLFNGSYYVYSVHVEPDRCAAILTGGATTFWREKAESPFGG